jgi:hypothetical protein
MSDNSSTFATHGVLSASTGILMGDIGALYEVASYLLGRSAFTHELAHYSKPIQRALIACHPELPADAPDGTWLQVRDEFIAEHGETMRLDEALRDVLADDKDPIATLNEMGFRGEVFPLVLE